MRARVLLIVGVLALLLGASWNASFEASPDGAVDIGADLDTFIQNLKDEIRERAEVETWWGPGGTALDNGLHRMGSARAFVQNSAPVNIGAAQYNAVAGTDAGTALTTTEAGAGGTLDLGAGRLWIDLDGPDDSATAVSDDQQLFVWNETANAFQAVVARDVSGSGVSPDNLIYHGSFEATDGTGAPGATAIPAGWTVLAGPPTYTYQDPTGVSEGEGLAVNITGVGADSGIQQTLAGLKASTTYVVRARANPTTAGDICTLNVTGGTVSPVTDTSATGSGVYETLEAVVTTTPGPANIVVQLRTTAAGDVCRWDHVVAFERYAPAPRPGVQVAEQIITGGTNDYFAADAWTDSGFSVPIVPPGPGYIVDVRSSLNMDADDVGLDYHAEVELRENGVSVDWIVCSADSRGHGTGSGGLNCRNSFTRVNPTPGTTLTYTLRVYPEGTPLDRNIALGGGGDEAAVQGLNQSKLTVLLIPTR